MYTPRQVICEVFDVPEWARWIRETAKIQKKYCGFPGAGLKSTTVGS